MEIIDEKKVSDLLKPVLEEKDGKLKYIKPKGYEEYAYIKTNIAYVQPDGIRAICKAAEMIGNNKVYYIARERVANQIPDQLDKSFSVDEYEELIKHRQKVGGLEAFIFGENGEWIVWIFHEPCLHIAGTKAFVDALKQVYPNCEPCNGYADSWAYWDRSGKTINDLKEEWKEYQEIQFQMNLSDRELSDLRMDYERVANCGEEIIVSVLAGHDSKLNHIPMCFNLLKPLEDKLQNYNPKTEKQQSEKEVFLKKVDKLHDLLGIVLELYNQKRAERSRSN